MRICRADLRCPKFQEMPSSVTVGWGLPASPTSGQHELPADAFLVTLVSGPRCLSQAQDWPSGLGLSQPRLRTFSDWFGRLPPCPHSIVDWPSLERGWQLGILHWPWQGAHCPPALTLAQWPSHRIHGQAIPVPRSPRLLSARQPGDAPGARASGGHGVALCPDPHVSSQPGSQAMLRELGRLEGMGSPCVLSPAHHLCPAASPAPASALGHVACALIHLASRLGPWWPRSVFMRTVPERLPSWPPGFPRTSLPFCRESFCGGACTAGLLWIPAFSLRPPSLRRVGDAAPTFLSLRYRFCPTSGLCGF